jgi:hypothetical protein
MPEPFSDLQIDIETTVHPTESVEKIQRAISNLFPDTVFYEPQDGRLWGTARAIGKLKERLAAQAIRDASRKVLLNGIRPGHLFFALSKQVAYVGRVNFSDDGPLGDIIVIVRTEQPGLLVDYLTDKKDEGPLPRRGHPRTDERVRKDEYPGQPGD